MKLDGESIFLELTSYTRTAEKTEYLIAHDVAIMKIVPEIFITRSGVDIFDDKGLHVFREEGDECDLGRFIEVM